MRPRGFWLVALLVAALGGFAIYMFSSPAAETPAAGMKKYIKAMSQKPQASQAYIRFSEQASILADDLNRLRKLTGSGKWEEISQTLTQAREAYERAWLLVPPLEAEINLDANVKGFLRAAGEAFNAQVGSLDKKLRAEEVKLASMQSELDSQKDRLETVSSSGGMPNQPRTEMVYFKTGSAPWLSAAFVAGFAFLIPWYKRFAEDEQYYSYSLTRTGGLTPVNIMILAAIAASAIFVAYLLIKEYLGALL